MVLLGLLAFTVGAVLPADGQEFAVDEHTLYLAHFNENARAADYAMGWKEFGGGGASLTEGYYGAAIDLRGIQFHPDFLTACSSRTPHFNYFGIWPRGNINFYQGTYEFWFRVSPDGLKQNHAGRNLFFTHWHQPEPGRFTFVELTQRRVRWSIFPLVGNALEGQVQFSPPLRPEEWHHWAMCWSPGEMVIYLDGRVLAAHDLSGKFGLALVAATQTPLAMNAVVLDELRISDVVRYSGEFEPRWRAGRRPPYAFSGAREVRRFPPRALAPVRPANRPAPASPRPAGFACGDFRLLLDESTGGLLGFSVPADWTDEAASRAIHGLLMWQGLERQPLAGPAASQWEKVEGGVTFQQEFPEGLRVRHRILGKGRDLAWEVGLENVGDRELWLETLLSLPASFGAIRQYFDMSCLQDQLAWPRRRDEYCFSLPLAVVSGSRYSLGVGLDPHGNYSALLSEWVPAGVPAVRQGTRVVLGPRESNTLRFHVFCGAGDFGALDAVAHYHGLFPELYRQVPGVPIYSYLPVCRYFELHELPDLARVAYIAEQWGHGPAHCKGDEWGTPKYWDMPKDPRRPDEAYAARLERTWKSLENMRAEMLRRSKRSFDNFYTLRRTHYLPNWPQRFIAEDLWPEGISPGDHLVCGQYYDQMYCTNEYRTPLGRHYQESTWNIMRHIGRYSPGFINDLCIASPFRFTDAIARRTPGRAFSPDRGVYLVAAFGHADRYELINRFTDDRGFRQSIWSDGGASSYALQARSAATAAEVGVAPIDSTGAERGLEAGRFLLGEKPFAFHFAKESDWTGRFYEAGQFSPKTLRDYYRYWLSQFLLSALRNGVYLPLEVLEGQQALCEYQPILVESIVAGRKIVPAAWVRPPLFLRRAGEGTASFLAVGNEQPEAIASDVLVSNRYFGGAPLWGAYFGGTLDHDLGAEVTRVKAITVGPRSVEALKFLGLVRGGGETRMATSFRGDGIEMEVALRGNLAAPASLELSSFAPMYEVIRLEINGRSAPFDPRRAIDLPAGEILLVARYHHRALAFNAEDWAAVRLIEGNKVNFCVVADTSSSFNAGTAGLLNGFLEQYDAEDGRLGNLARAEILPGPPRDFPGWTVVIDPRADVRPARVRIDRNAREIRVEGATQGDARRAMTVFLRLLDRKYPHIGGFFPRKYFAEQPWEKQHIKETRAFFAEFADPEFLLKPILREEFEPLYQGGNRDFQGKYALRAAPYLFEPTYAEDYVYGTP